MSLVSKSICFSRDSLRFICFDVIIRQRLKKSSSSLNFFCQSRRWNKKYVALYINWYKTFSKILSYSRVTLHRLMEVERNGNEKEMENTSKTHKQPLADVLQNSCFKKFRNIHRKTLLLGTEGLQLYQKKDYITVFSMWKFHDLPHVFHILLLLNNFSLLYFPLNYDESTFFQ